MIAPIPACDAKDHGRAKRVRQVSGLVCQRSAMVGVFLTIQKRADVAHGLGVVECLYHARAVVQADLHLHPRNRSSHTYLIRHASARARLQRLTLVVGSASFAPPQEDPPLVGAAAAAAACQGNRSKPIRCKKGTPTTGAAPGWEERASSRRNKHQHECAPASPWPPLPRPRRPAHGPRSPRTP